MKASQIRIIIMIIIIVVYSDAGKIRSRTYDIRCLNARYLVESKLRIKPFHYRIVYRYIPAALVLVRGHQVFISDTLYVSSSLLL